jgi:hypothetical protein
MWGGTSSPDDKLTDDLGNAIEGTRISGRRWIFLTVEKLAPSDLRLLQQYRHKPAVSICGGKQVEIPQRSSLLPYRGGTDRRP